MISETVHSLPQPHFSCKDRLRRVIFALMKASSAVAGQAIRPSRPSRPTIQACLQQASGNQYCFPAALPIRSPLSGPFAQLSAYRSGHTPFPLTTSHGNTDFEPAVFPSSSGIFSFLSACVDSFPLLYPFRTIIMLIIQHGFPRGLLSCGFNMPYSVFRFFIF